MGNTITIASTILLGFGTVMSIPNTYEYYQTPNYEINSFMPNNFSNLPNLDATNSLILQVSILNSNPREEFMDEISSFVHSIVDNSKSLDSDFSKFVSENFWELI